MAEIRPWACRMLPPMERQTLTLIGTGLSPFVLRVMLAARHKGLALQLEAPSGGTRSAEHLALNPMGKVPVLIDGALVLPESEVILGYLDDRFPTPALWPGDAAERAHVRLLVRLQDTYGPPSFNAFLINDRPAIEISLQRVRDSLSYLEHYRRDGEHAAGTAFSAADCALIPFFCIYERLQPAFQTLDLVHAHPKLSAWWARARASEAGTFAGAVLDEAVRGLQAPGRR